MNITDILDNLSNSTGSSIKFDILKLLKFPVGIIIFGNILFGILLLLRVRILADTLSTQDNRVVKTIVVINILVGIVGGIIALLFMLIG
ncbi:MAG: hypothetical protein PHE21_02405 [Candidatus Dojkabacteria bacterium]|nr:hypothetical protein [Candidatus Dojkabacteria bacterium]